MIERLPSSLRGQLPKLEICAVLRKRLNRTGTVAVAQCNLVRGVDPAFGVSQLQTIAK
jgi:hypothetical protein